MVLQIADRDTAFLARKGTLSEAEKRKGRYSLTTIIVFDGSFHNELQLIC